MNRFLLIIISLKLSCTFEMDDPDLVPNENSQLGIRAVVIPCDVPEEGFRLDSDTIRFQREELFKHNALQDCKQKLGITIKMSSDPNQALGDEYIPIEHVLGVNRKRIRLLNPYVLRLRRKAPFQAYKLRRIDTVRGVLVNFFEEKSIGIRSNESSRMQRDIDPGKPSGEDWTANDGFDSKFKLDHDNGGRHSYSIKIRDPKQPVHKTTANTKVPSRITYFDHKYLCPKNNGSLNLRDKRHSKKDVKDYEYKYNLARWTSTDLTPQSPHQVYDNTFHREPSHKVNEQQSENILYEDKHLFDDVDKSNDIDNDNLRNRANKVTDQIQTKSYNGKDISKMVSPEFDTPKSSEINTKLYKKILEYNLEKCSDDQREEKDFIIYDIGDPDLWYSAQVQLFEKLSTPEGKTVWNDLMKDETACVNSANPEWSNQNVDIQYKPVEFIAREDFMLPVTDLCLVVPAKHNYENGSKSELLIVPVDDVITLEDPKEINKRNENSEFNTSSNGVNEQRHRQVIVRTTRALMGGTTNSLKIVSRGSDRYLKLPHTKPHYTQMDLEAKADDNELILVGVFGRLTTIVSDTTRRIRSILTVQATNTGLAAARMRVITRDCSPELLDSNTEKDESIAGPIILPPKHTRTFRLKIPLEIPVESANCTIALVNDDDESVAVRDVRIKRDDRCYCVWHCDCVCLGEDPNLLCRDMTPAQLLAAGLSTHQKSRHSRSVCYPDMVPLNLFVSFIGVLIVLLILGLAKAILGLACRCVATWGLHRFLDTPRKLDHYYERLLRERRVVYDEEGWPVHPDTKERTVGLVSEPMEFILNVIFFVTLPCLMVWDTLKKLLRCQGLDVNSDANYNMNENCKKCFSSRDVQVDETRKRRRRRRGLHRWMTPQAEELTANIWHDGLTTLEKRTRVCLQPLLQDESGFRKTCEQSSFIDSEQDDTEYVLMQMQKSRESLARSQRQQDTKTNTMNPWKGSNNATVGASMNR